MDLSQSQKDLLNMTLDELVECSANTKTSQPDHDFRLALIKARSIQSLKKSIDESSCSSQQLSQKIYWLNIILAFTSVVMAGVAIANFVCKSS